MTHLGHANRLASCHDVPTRLAMAQAIAAHQGWGNMPMSSIFVRFVVAAIACLAAAGVVRAAEIDAATRSKLNGLNQAWRDEIATGQPMRVIVRFTLPDAALAHVNSDAAGADKLLGSFVRTRQAEIVASLLGPSPGLDGLAASQRYRLKLMTLFPMFAIEATPEELDRLASDARVVSIERDRPVRAQLDESVPLLGMPAAYDLGATGEGFVVAVLDTGARRSHEFLANQIVSEACYSHHAPAQGYRSMCPGFAASSIADGSANDCNTFSANGCGHGSHVAGIAAGHNWNRNPGEPRQGVATDGGILSINVFTRGETAAVCSDPQNPDPTSAPCVISFPSDQIAAMDRVYALRTTLRIAAVNMSLGNDADIPDDCDMEQSSLKTAIDRLRAVNIATVVAAGNFGHDAGVGSPACISSAVTVAASTDTDRRASYSNWGPMVDLVAPGGAGPGDQGTGIYAPMADGNSLYIAKSGTSMAAPHVAGAFAAIRTKFPNATVAQIEAALKQTGKPIESAGAIHPRIRVVDAIYSLQGRPPTAPENDHLTNAIAIDPPITLNGRRTVAGSNVGATMEPGEENMSFPRGSSVWWTYTLRSSSLGNNPPVRISTEGTTTPHTLYAYWGFEGSFDSLIPFLPIHFGEEDSLYIDVRAGEGVTIYIKVANDPSDPQQGPIRLSVTGGGGPPDNVDETAIYASVLPGARATRVGTEVTVFATILNAGVKTARDCTIRSPETFGMHFRYRLYGQGGLGSLDNQPVDIPAFGRQDYVLYVTSDEETSDVMQFVFDCSNTLRAPVVNGVNTLLFTASNSFVADIISTAVTPSGDGFLTVPIGGAAAVAIAAVNIGAASNLTAIATTAPIGGPPVDLEFEGGICRTNAQSLCITPIAETLSFSLAANQVATFAGFVQSTGEIPANPALNRVFLHFYQGNVPVGSTSVAIRTVSP